MTKNCLIVKLPPIPCMAWPLCAICALSLNLTVLTGCVSVKTEHRVEPIQITMDVNVRLERELEDAFGALDARSQEIAENQSEKGEE